MEGLDVNLVLTADTADDVASMSAALQADEQASSQPHPFVLLPYSYLCYFPDTHVTYPVLQQVTRILLDFVALGQVSRGCMLCYFMIQRLTFVNQMLQEYGIRFPRDFGLLLKQVLYFGWSTHS